MQPSLQIFVLSDGTGETAEKMVRAGLSQFGVTAGVQIRLFPSLRTLEELQPILTEARHVAALVTFTLVQPELRDCVQRAERSGLRCVDLLGSLVASLSEYLQLAPRGVPGLLHAVSEEYFRRMEAVGFTVKNDDGQNPESLHEADLILVGVSRTSKTPLSIYIAQRGIKVANVPLVMGVPLPHQLDEVLPGRVVALMIQPDALQTIRQSRIQHLKMPSGSSYGQRHAILEELRHARAVFQAHPQWPVIDITGKSIEETASQILQRWQGVRNEEE